MSELVGSSDFLNLDVSRLGKIKKKMHPKLILKRLGRKICPLTLTGTIAQRYPKMESDNDEFTIPLLVSGTVC